MNDEKRVFREINMTLEEAEKNWVVIETFSPSINKFKNLEEYRNDKNISNFLNELWINYLKENNVIVEDENRC